jgi:hypothetical protein
VRTRAQALQQHYEHSIVRAPSNNSAIYLKRLGAAYAASIVLLITNPTIAGAPENPTPFEQTSAFHIGAGSLASALLQFSRQTQIQVITNAPVSEITVAGVQGRLTAREALAALLGATGLVYTIVGNTVAIHAAATPADTRSTRLRNMLEMPSKAGLVGADAQTSR